MIKQENSKGLVLLARASNGFTLLEILIATVILTLLSVVIAQVFFSTMRTNSKTEVARDVKGSGDRSLETMTRLVQNAALIQPPASCPEHPAVGGTLDEIKLTNADAGETTIKCLASGGIARIASVSSSQTVYLTGPNVTLIDPVAKTNACTNHALSFTCSSVRDTPAFITIGFTLRQKNTSASTSDTASTPFQTTVTVRNK